MKYEFINKNKIQIILTIFFVYFFLSIFSYLKILIYSHSGDTSLFIDILDKIAKYNDFHISSVHSTFFHFFFGNYLTADPVIFCEKENLEKIKRIKDLNMFEVSHLYFIAWILSIPKKAGLDLVDISAFYFSFIYSALILLVYLYLKAKTNLFSSLIFLVILLTWKPLSLSMFGQLYFDKFYLLFMFFYIFLHLKFRENEEKKLIPLLVISGILVCSVHERAALMLSLFIFSEIILNKIINFKKKQHDHLILFLGFISFCYFFSYSVFFHNNPLGHHLSINQAYNELKDILTIGNIKSILSLKMLIVLSPILFFSFFNKKMFLISIISILPNLLISIGGAEKIGFSTHYHTYYIPFLIASSILGYINFKKKYSNKFFFGSVIIFFLCLNLKYNENSSQILKFNYNFLNSHLFYALSKNQNQYFVLNEIKKHKIKIREIIKNDSSKKNITLSMDEYYMPSFFQNDYDINVFPLEIVNADYLITSIKNELIYVPSFLSNEKKKEKIQNCVQSYIDKYFLLLEKVKLGNNQTLIYKKRI